MLSWVVFCAHCSLDKKFQ